MSLVLCLLLSYLAEEVEGEVVITLHKLLFLVCEADVVARVRRLLAHVLPDEEDCARVLFAYDVDERTVCNELGIAGTGVLADVYDGNGRCLSPFLVKLYLCCLLHHADIDILIAELIEAVAALEGIRHSQ